MGFLVTILQLSAYVCMCVCVCVCVCVCGCVCVLGVGWSQWKSGVGRDRNGDGGSMRWGYLHITDML